MAKISTGRVLVFLVVLAMLFAVRSLPRIHQAIKFSRFNLGDGGPARLARFGDPAGIYRNERGQIFIADRDCRRVRMIDINGIITTIAGNGRRCFNDEGIQATEASLDYPDGVCPDGLGNLLIPDLKGNRIWKLTSDGELYTFAGTGEPGSSGDGGPATEAQVWYPTSCSLGSEGEIVFAENKGNRVRKVDRSGIITTIAGTGMAGFSGDDGPAIKAQLNGPYGVAIAPSGDIYITDSGNHRVRHVNLKGIITTIAGTGEKGYSGDNVLATDAQLNAPQGIYVMPTGDLLIVDEHNHVVKILHKGVLRNIAGIGRSGYMGDGGPAIKASLNDPESVWVASDGTILFCDGDNRVVRQINPAGIISTIAGVYCPR